MRRNNIDRDINGLNEQLANVISLRETLRTHGWAQVAEIFRETIQKFLQDVYDKCDNPKKNEIEIRCKKMTADALGKILSTLDARAKSERETFLKQQLQQKTALKAEMKKGISNG